MHYSFPLHVFEMISCDSPDFNHDVLLGGAGYGPVGTEELLLLRENCSRVSRDGQKAGL